MMLRIDHWRRNETWLLLLLLLLLMLILKLIVVRRRQVVDVVVGVAVVARTKYDRSCQCSCFLRPQHQVYFDSLDRKKILQFSFSFFVFRLSHSTKKEKHTVI